MKEDKAQRLMISGEEGRRNCQNSEAMTISKAGVMNWRSPSRPLQRLRIKITIESKAQERCKDGGERKRGEDVKMRRELKGKVVDTQ